MRLRFAGLPRTVEVGYKKCKKERGKIKGKIPVSINNINELEKIKQNEIAVLAKVGMKNKINIAKKAKESGIKIANLNVDKFLEELKVKDTKNENKETKK